MIYCVPVHSLRVDSRKIKKHVLGFHRWARRQEVLSESCPVSSFLGAGCVPQSSTLCPWFLGNITVLESCPLHVHGSQSCISTEIYTHIQTQPVCGVGSGGVPESWCRHWLCSSLTLAASTALSPTASVHNAELL